MTLGKLSHFSIRVEDLEPSRRFYEEIVGLVVGPRPPFRFPGYWMYIGEQAVLHLIGVDHADKTGLVEYLDDRDESGLIGSGAIDHIAFDAAGLAETRRRIEAKGVAFKERNVPDLGLHQIFVEDPNGVVIELVFPADEAAQAAE